MNLSTFTFLIVLTHKQVHPHIKLSAGMYVPMQRCYAIFCIIDLYCYTVKPVLTEH